MASVTKTITETIGEIQKTTSLYFASFEDFMEYERVVNKESQQDNQTTLKELVVGKEYRITKRLHGHGFDIGTVVIVSDLDQDGEYRAELPDGSDYWYIQPEEVEEI